MHLEITIRVNLWLVLLVYLKKLRGTAFECLVKLRMLDNIANKLKHFNREMAVNPHIWVYFVQIVHVVIADVLNLQFM